MTTAHTLAGGFAASESGGNEWRELAVKIACRLVGPSFVRQVVEFGRGLRLLRGVVEVRPYTVPCGCFGRHSRHWRLILPCSLKSGEVDGTCGPSSASAGYGVAFEAPCTHSEGRAAFSNVCIREHGSVCNGGSVVSRGCDKPQDLVYYPPKRSQYTGSTE